jgi:hypothetical protein
MVWKLDTKELDRIAAKLNVNRDAIIRRAAFEVEAQAKQNAPYDTTALRNSIYVVTDKEDNYSQAANKAKANNPEVRTEPHPKPTKGSVFVGPCVEYAEYVEYPGAVRKGGERPYLTPAAENVMNKYNSGEAWKELCE